MKKNRSAFYWLSWLLVLSLVAVYIVARNIPQRYADWRQQRQQMDSYQKDVEVLQQELEQAKERVAGLNSDPVEDEAAVRHAQRDKVRPGETIYYLQPEAASNESEP